MQPSPIAYDDWTTDGHSFSWHGHKVFYRSEGTGAPLLLLHGFPTCSWDWSWISGRLAQTYRLIIPDMLDCGRSRNPFSRSLTIMDQVDMLADLLAELDLPAVRILAHDVGDTIAQEILARQQERRFPTRILSVTYLNGGLLPDHHRPTPGQELLAGPFGWFAARFAKKEVLLEAFGDVFAEKTRPGRDLLNAFWPSIVGINGRGSLRRRIGYMAERAENAHRWVGAVKGTTTPQHLIVGLEDPVSGGHMAKALARIAPMVAITALEGIGHYPQVEAPEQVVDAFLSRIAPKTETFNRDYLG